MIIVIDGINQHKFKDVLDEMFKLRARVFGDRLGWEVNIQDGREFDQFDSLNPAHVVSINDEGEVVGNVSSKTAPFPGAVPAVS